MSSNNGSCLEDGSTRIGDLRIKVRAFLRERDWEKFHTPMNLASSISIEAAELLEVFQWMSEEEVIALGSRIVPRVTEELADVMIYCLSMANSMEIDLAKAIVAKLRANEKKYPAKKWKGKAYL